MAKLTAATRKKIPLKDFGLPDAKPKPKYPMQDKSHAANAKARATQQLDKGNLTRAQKKKIDRKANEVLYGKATAPSSDDKRLNNYVRNR